MKFYVRIMLAAVGALSSPVLAINTIWQLPSNAAVRASGDYKHVACSAVPPAPYVGDLQLQSKYDQSDPTKSKLTDKAEATIRIEEILRAYLGGLIKSVKRFGATSGDADAEIALACFDHWLDSWATGGALLNTDASNTGKAARKWMLASIASASLQMSALSGGVYKPSDQALNWITRMAQLVIFEYEGRRVESFRWFNNHDYWAAWAVAASAILLDRHDFLDWADACLRLAFRQAIIADERNYAYFPLEVARGDLAADYSNYAFVPLTLLVEVAEANQKPLSEDESNIYRLLASFNARLILQPERLNKIVWQNQKSVSKQKLVWLIPYLTRFPNEYWARKLYVSRNGDVDGYSQIGGPIKSFYPSLD